MKLLRSLSFRLALTYAGLFFLSSAVLVGLYYWAAVIRPMDQLQARIAREAKLVSQIYIVDGAQAARNALDRRIGQANERRAYHALILPGGAVLTANLPSWPAGRFRGWAMLEADIARGGFEADHAPMVREVRFRDGARLIIGRDAEDIDKLDERVKGAVPWVLGSTVLLALAGGLLMSRAIGQRIEAINRAARQVMTGDLSGRVPVLGSDDDFDRLGETLNLMLARNEELFEAMRRLSDNVAHELRTPLARLLAQLDRLEAADADRGQRAEAHDAAVTEALRLKRIFDALLRISRIESGHYTAGLRQTDLSRLAGDALEFHQPVAAGRDVSLHGRIEPGVVALVDPDLLFQAVSNLLDNAIKHAASGGTVRLVLAPGQAGVLLAVRDDGPGLAPGEAGRVTERFFRGTNAAALPGEGLGLSLVAAIARLHGAHLRFEDNRPGLVVSLELPLTR